MNSILKYKTTILVIIVMLSLFSCFKKEISRKSGLFPQRVISLGPVLTEEIYLLGAGEQLIADTTYCTRPKDAEKKIKIGNVIDINIEKILSLNPDIVFATSLNYPKEIEKLKRFNINVEVFIQPTDYKKLCSEFLRLGKLLGKEKTAEKIIGDSNKKVDAIKEKFTDIIKKKIFVQIGASPLFTVNKDSYINDFIELAGGINIAKDSIIGPYSREKVIASSPDIIIIATMGIVGKEEKKIWERYKSINAVRNNDIHILDAYKVCSANPASFADTLEEIAKIIHPDLF